MKRNLYELIGVKSDASQEQIEAACDAMLGGRADHATKVVVRYARDTLCSSVRRTAYDTSLKPGKHTTIGWDDPVSVGHGGRSKLYWLLVIAIPALIWIYHRHGKPAAPSTELKSQASVSVQQSLPTSEVTRQADATRLPLITGQSGQPRLSYRPEAVYVVAAPSVALVLSMGANGRPFATGSGVVIGMQQVVTNCHVVQQAVNVIVKHSGTEYPAYSGISDRYLDLCILHVPSLNAPEAKRGSVKELRVGETVYAIGAPQGLDRSLSQGLVSALREMSEGTIIQTTAVIAPGSSGGGLFTADGRLVGITTAQSKISNIINFAVPIDWLDKMQTR